MGRRAGLYGFDQVQPPPAPSPGTVPVTALVLPAVEGVGPTVDAGTMPPPATAPATVPVVPVVTLPTTTPPPTFATVDRTVPGERGMRWEKIMVLPRELGVSEDGRLDAEVWGTNVDPDERAEVGRFVDRWREAGIFQWADLALAGACFRYAVELTSEAAEQAIDALPYAAQIDRVVDAWRWLGRGYQAANLPPMSDPEYVRVITRDIDGGAARPCESKAWAQWLAADPARGGYRDADGGPACLTIHHRLALTPRGSVVDQYVRGPTQVGDPAWPQQHLPPSRVWNWRSWALRHSCQVRTGVTCTRYEDVLFPPLVWYFQQAREIARACVARGALQTLVRGHQYAFVKNLRTVAATGRLEDLLRSATNAQLTEQLTSLVGEAELGLHDAEVGGMNPQILDGVSLEDAGSGLLGLAATTAPIAPLAAILGIAGGILRLVALLPAAVARNQDVFFRDQPVFEVRAMHDDASTPPPWEVAPPPGFRRGTSRARPWLVRPRNEDLLGGGDGLVTWTPAVVDQVVLDPDKAPGAPGASNPNPGGGSTAPSTPAPSSGVPGVVKILGAGALAALVWRVMRR